MLVEMKYILLALVMSLGVNFNFTIIYWAQNLSHIALHVVCQPSLKNSVAPFQNFILLQNL